MIETVLNRELLAILRCPKCKGELHLVPDELICQTCRLAYAVADGIPNMLIEEARSFHGGSPEATS